MQIEDVGTKELSTTPWEALLRGSRKMSLTDRMTFQMLGFERVDLRCPKKRSVSL